ncbi:hypothetical protein CZ771_10930 [Actinomycetales bacterium JB111]|nr:hypothetical protein CZ771_10930 [Actinomycetales bacterium JB111]
MPIIDFTTDIPARTITITARFEAPVRRVFALYADPRQVEQIWGPVGYPATFVSHELTPGTRSTYFMTSPEGERYGGYWDVTAVDEPHGFTVRDGFADPEGNPLEAMPTSTMDVRLEPDGDATLMTTVTTFATEDGIRKVVEMGIEEGTRSAMGQIDGFLAAHPE